MFFHVFSQAGEKHVKNMQGSIRTNVSHFRHFQFFSRFFFLRTPGRGSGVVVAHADTKTNKLYDDETT